jgi:molybdenum cofactor cytidylyltransferase
MTSRRFAALVPSAGASRRFGGEPKALLPVDGETAIRRIVRAAGDLGASSIVVVVGVHAREITSALKGEAVTIVENPAWEAGRTGSIQRGLQEIAPDDDVLLWPVDHPFVETSTVERLMHVARADELAWWFIPTFRDHGGHPVLLRAEVRPRVTALSPEAPLRGLLPELGIYVRRIVVDDPGVIEAIDTPEAYVMASQGWRLRKEGGA